MHFRRPRKQRSENRIGTTFYASTFHRTDEASIISRIMSRFGSRNTSIVHSRTRSTLRQLVSRFHAIRNRPLAMNENQLLLRYFENQEDPWMKEVIIEHCIDRPDLQHITPQYLDRMAKLKLFL